jgi:hypothetical protein
LNIFIGAFLKKTDRGLARQVFPSFSAHTKGPRDAGNKIAILSSFCNRLPTSRGGKCEGRNNKRPALLALNILERFLFN